LATTAFIQQFITDQVSQYGYVAIFFLMLLGSACVPIPSEVVMLFGGALASATFAEEVLSGEPLNLAAVVVAGLAGSLIGSWLAYWIGYAGGRALIDRWGRYLLFRPHEVDRAHAWFERHGQGLVFFGRLIPLLRAFVSLPAGVAQMDFYRFTLYTFLGIVPWTVGLAWGGYVLGEGWKTIDDYFQPLGLAAGVVALLALAWWVAKRWREKRSGGDDDPAESDSASP